MTSVLSAIRAGAARPVAVLPGDLGSTFVQRLFIRATSNWSPTEQKLFPLLRSTCLAANQAATARRDDEADTWLDLASSLLDGFSAESRPVTLGYLRFNQAYVFYTRQQYPRALACVDEGIAAANRRPQQALTPADIAGEHLRLLHGMDLKARIHLASQNPRAALDILKEGLQHASRIPRSPDMIELLDHCCSRLHGEIAICARAGLPPADYLARLENHGDLVGDGSGSELLLFLDAYRAHHLAGDSGPMQEFLRMGRKKTACWYVATLELADTLPTDELKSLVVLASTWTDMPAILRSQLLARLVAKSGKTAATATRARQAP